VKDTVSIEEYQAIIAKKNQQIELLRFELDQLKKLIFYSKRERFIPTSQPEQLSLGFEQEITQQAVVPEVEQISYQRNKPKAHPGRTQLPEHLPCEDIVIELQEDTKDMVEIGQEITETIDYRPGVLFKRRYIRKKYARKQEQQEKAAVIMAALPERPLPKAIAEAGLLSHLLVSKYIDHLPFYRQIQQFKRNHDWVIAPSTLNDWFAACCTLLEPLYECLFDKVMDTNYLQADESPIKVLDSQKKGKTHQGYMWVYRNPVNGLVLFDYRKGRSMQGPKQQLEGFCGHLQCDGYSVYDTLAKKRQGEISLVSCLAHIRRKFFDAKAHHAQLANQGLQYIQALYRLERTYREEQLQAEQIAKRRQQEAQPIFQAFLEWVKEKHNKTLSKGPIGKALQYTYKQLPKLTPYLTDGRIQIDNNLIENAIRPLALGRKNYLFAGSHKAAQRAAFLYSFFATCKVHEVNPWEWLHDILKRIAELPINQIDQLLPHLWKQNSNM